MSGAELDPRALRREARALLDSTVVGVELTLISIVQEPRTQGA